jgi:glutamate-1-semialdehyde aminotransferase
MTGAERVAFCDTSSEAVQGAIRIARTVTGRSRIARFSGAHHDIDDAVSVCAGQDHRAAPASPGSPGESTADMLVLDDGAPESLALLEARADEIAAVVVEPVPHGQPQLQPREFLHALRALTARTGVVLIFDERVTGFRAAPGGAQEHFGIRADLVTYGSVVGGGLPIGVIAGRSRFMDALDGGDWRYGDASVPDLAVTPFAGASVRHPLALAAARAMLEELERRGPALQRELTTRTRDLAERITMRARVLGFPIEIRHFASMWRTTFTVETAHADLLFYQLRDRGLHIDAGVPCFLTVAHDDDDLRAIEEAFVGAMEELQDGGFFPGPPPGPVTSPVDWLAAAG